MTSCLAFCLHALGASAAEFDDVAAALGDDFDVMTLDLPGFGANDSTGYTVEQMADSVVASITRAVSGRQVSRWILVGHSMGGKIATVVAHRTMTGQAPLFGLAGVVLLAASPPSPEPMDEERRAQMLGWVAGGAISVRDARTFVDANVASSLTPARDALLLADLKRTNPQAWQAWLERGSREDWSPDVGCVPLPALIMAGADDGDLGVDAQERLNVPVYERSRVVELPGTGHFLPLERPAEVADAIGSFWRDVAGHGPHMPADFAAVIASDRVSMRARSALARRAVADDADFRATVLTERQLATLRVVAALVVPQDGERIDLAARVEAQLGSGRGDGWRPATLPPDDEAYRDALDMLAELTSMPLADAQELLSRVADGSWAGDGPLSGTQLSAWFEDCVADLTRQWLGHPATMAGIGYDGFANGGDGTRKTGWLRLEAGARETWEPAMSGSRAES